MVTGAVKCAWARWGFVFAARALRVDEGVLLLFVQLQERRNFAAASGGGVRPVWWGAALGQVWQKAGSSVRPKKICGICLAAFRALALEYECNPYGVYYEHVRENNQERAKFLKAVKDYIRQKCKTLEPVWTRKRRRRRG